ncbi:unnamed protein product, partial [Mesorhabditis belari]|uniref:Uncharacterized protein n=1 Tax=Mesorhabditis belari TaxID=2138241 RepID=A0AAF3ECK2_9BILA
MTFKNLSHGIWFFSLLSTAHLFPMNTSSDISLWPEFHEESCKIAPSTQQVNFLPLLKSLSEFFRIGNCSNACGKLITELINGKAASSHCVCTRFSDETDDKLSGDFVETATGGGAHWQLAADSIDAKVAMTAFIVLLT